MEAVLAVPIPAENQFSQLEALALILKPLELRLVITLRVVGDAPLSVSALARRMNVSRCHLRAARESLIERGLIAWDGVDKWEVRPFSAETVPLEPWTERVHPLDPKEPAYLDRTGPPGPNGSTPAHENSTTCSGDSGTKIASSLTHSLEALSRVVSECVAREIVPLAPTDPLAQKFDLLPSKFDASAEVVCQFLREKAREKGKRLWNAGALYEFTLMDFPPWLKRRKPPQVEIPKGAVMLPNGTWMFPNEMDEPISRSAAAGSGMR